MRDSGAVDLLRNTVTQWACARSALVRSAEVPINQYPV